jgi:hypothetical protein
MIRLVLVGAAAVSAVAFLGAGPMKAGSQDQPGARSQAAPPLPAPSTRPVDEHRIPDRAELERRFRQTLTGATLRGQWQMSRFDGDRAGDLSEPRSETYAIQSAEKSDGDYWIITARIQFGERDATLPVRVRVVWAGDTPVITLDDLNLPLLGKYSARVMIYRDYYSGTWFGAGYGGVMAGQITHAAEAATTQPVSRP